MSVDTFAVSKASPVAGQTTRSTLDAVTDTVVRIMCESAGPLRRVSVSYDTDGARVEVDLDPGPAAPHGQPTESPGTAPTGPTGPTADPAGAHQVITSPMVGVVYLAPEPNADTFVAVDSEVQAGQQLCVVEAMKLMNAVRAEQAGTVVDVLVNDGAAVEYGQPLFTIDVA
ncbi:MAG TPA: biotin/lipoyl-containing protein [Pseudonocardiaceae bacterium]|nr:biotin/lipoyl-containing protein [Pseudonocardiaceae bacterium]